MKTFEEAMKHAGYAKSIDACSDSGKALIILRNHILESTLETDEQILQTWSDKALAADYYPPGYTLKEHVLRFARALLSAPPVDHFRDVTKMVPAAPQDKRNSHD